jgi:predicted transposase/invertase (TIGR01784 family)
MKPIEELTFTDDYMFGYVMRNEEICKGLLERLLKIKIERLEYPELQKSISPYYESKGIRLDVFVKDSNKIIDLEMQTTIPPALEKRVRYYQSIMDISELEKGKGYDEVKDSFVVFLCLKDPFSENFPVYTVIQKFEENINIDYTDGRHIVFFNAAAYKSAKSESIKSFLEYLSTQNSKNELTNKIKDIVSTTRKKEEFGRSYMIANMRDIMMKKEAFKDGLTEGRQEGIEQAKIEMAKNALAMNLDLQQICKLTGLPLETVETLKNN